MLRLVSRCRALAGGIAALTLAAVLAGPVLAQFAPTGPEIPVSAHTDNHQRAPAVAVGGDGRFVVAWESVGQDGSGSGVYARRFDPAGVPRGVEFRVNETLDYDQDTPAVAMLPDGRFVATTVRSRSSPSA